MPVPSTITDLTPVAATNSPAGTESVKGTIDDYLRAGFSFIRQIYDQSLGPTVTLASAGTVAVGFAGSVNILITGTATITAFDAVAEGTLRWVVFGGAMTLAHSGASFYLPGGTNIATAAGDVALFKSLGGGNWKCMLYQRVALRYPVAGTLLSDASPVSIAQGGTSATTAAVALANLGALPLAGGAMNGGLVIDTSATGGGQNLSINNVAGVPQVRYAGVGGVKFVRLNGNSLEWINQAYNAVIMSISDAGLLTATTITQLSDERKKRGWQHLPKDFISQLAGIKKSGLFTWRRGGAAGLGVGAQSLERILPLAVHTDERGTKTVNYGAAAMVSAVELARAHVALEKRLAALEAK